MDYVLIGLAVLLVLAVAVPLALLVLYGFWPLLLLWHLGHFWWGVAAEGFYLMALSR